MSLRHLSMSFPHRAGWRGAMRVGGLKLSPLGRAEILSLNSTQRQAPRSLLLFELQPGRRCLHTTGRAYQNPPNPGLSENGPNLGSGPKPNSTKPSKNGTTTKLLRRTVQATLLLLALNITLDATGLSTTILSWIRGRPLNESLFVPFTITSKEQVSPTAFILTLRPKHSPDHPSPLTSFFRATHAASLGALLEQNGPGISFFYWPLFLRRTHSSGPVISEAHRHGLWSVEVRQPQLQVAREYTPLPPVYSERDADRDLDADEGTIRLLVRRLHGGEVSTYLAGLGPGDDVDLRGPHLGYDVRARLGVDGESGAGGRSGKGVVFLAGGTGIAPAMQVASALLDGDAGIAPRVDVPVSVSILWANRQRADCAALLDGSRRDGAAEGYSGGSIVAQLAEMQARHPGRLTVRCVVDEEQTFISGRDIAGATKAVAPGGNNSSVAPIPPSQECRIHSQKWIAARPAHEIPGESCSCGSEAQGPHVTGGKNLVFVSGPEGFVDAYAGPKRWAAGRELQGPVAGLLGRMRKSDPEGWRGWVVLKL